MLLGADGCRQPERDAAAHQLHAHVNSAARWRLLAVLPPYYCGCHKLLFTLSSARFFPARGDVGSVHTEHRLRAAVCWSMFPHHNSVDKQPVTLVNG